jgi:hypothetical protein
VVHDKKRQDPTSVPDADSSVEVMCVKWKMKVEERAYVCCRCDSSVEVMCVKGKMKVQECRLVVDAESIAEVM